MLTTYERMNYLETAHNIVDGEETDVTHEQVDAMSDYDLVEWVDTWRESDDDESGDD
ncbi:MAG: hypothetical protein KAX65_04670 [Caldilineaceae bacterium]|nr:hypothetical protein [Caldilineaceae bacterium]